eukprot:3887951-Rhodomonas_salina.1
MGTPAAGLPRSRTTPALREPAVATAGKSRGRECGECLEAERAGEAERREGARGVGVGGPPLWSRRWAAIQPIKELQLLTSWKPLCGAVKGSRSWPGTKA